MKTYRVKEPFLGLKTGEKIEEIRSGATYGEAREKEFGMRHIELFLLEKLGVIEEVKEEQGHYHDWNDKEKCFADCPKLLFSMTTGQDYYYINTFFEIAKKVWSGLSDDKRRMEVDNCFPTREAAEQARERIIKALKNKE